jgi:HK97 family phage major capsid protein
VAGVYNSLIQRAASGPDAFVPEPLATSIIEEAPKASAALTLCNRTILSTKTNRLPVLDVLPFAYWVGGDTGLKQTTQMQWKNVILVVEELACIVPIPENYLDDADVPLWAQVQPRLAEAVGNLIDLAVLWGVNKPATWGESVYTGAGKSGQYVIAGTGVDLGQDVAKLAQNMAVTGYTVNGFAAMPGMNWQLIGIRSAQGVPIYEPDMQNGRGGNLYGFTMSEVNNGSWDATKAMLLCGDFSKAIIGVRQDITYKTFTEGVISDDTGKVILNLMQQDSVALRLTMRLAYATVNPVTIMKPTAVMSGSNPQRWPFGAVLPVGATAPTAAALTTVQTYPAGAGG